MERPVARTLSAKLEKHLAGSIEPQSGGSPVKKATLLVALLITLGVICSHAQSPTSTTPATDHPTFDAVSVKPGNSAEPGMRIQFQPGGRFVATNTPLRNLIILAYQLPISAGREAIIGAPNWVDTERYNIEAKAEAEGNPTGEQNRAMVQSLLADRFKLAAHWETRQLPIYALVLSKAGKAGPQLVPHAADNSTCRDLKAQPLAPPQPGGAPFVAPIPCGGGFLISHGHIGAEGTMEQLAKDLSWFGDIDRAVVDKTGLSGTFDVNLDYAPFSPQPGSDASPADSSLAPTIFTALQEQLGLKLESQTGPVNVLVVDHVEEPSPN
jgi:uncharacterized protein (TIGR03435 family)